MKVALGPQIFESHTMNRITHFKFVARLLAGLACAWVMGAMTSALAQDLASAVDVTEATRQWVDHSLKNATAAGGEPLRMEVSLGNLDSRLRLAPCAQIEPYLPVNTRLWGKTRIGLRCLQGATHWNVFLPVTVKAFGPAWVLRDAIAPGGTLKAEDAMLAEVDWANEPSSIIADAGQWIGQVTAYTLSAGQALRQAMVRPPQVFQSGASVRILAQGMGFSVSSDGQALNPGIVGQLARVRTDAGRVVSGVVLDTHTVKIDL